MRIRLVTRDGILVANGTGDPSYYWRHGRLDKEFTEMRLTYDCRQKGVKLIDYDYEFGKEGLISIQALVEWC